MNSTIVIILIVVAVLVLALIAFLIIRRQRYVRALRGRGWTFESRPSLESVLDHHAPGRSCEDYGRLGLRQHGGYSAGLLSYRSTPEPPGMRATGDGRSLPKG